MKTNLIGIFTTEESAKSELIYAGYTDDVTKFFKGSCRCECGERRAITFQNPETNETKSAGICQSCGQE